MTSERRVGRALKPGAGPQDRLDGPVGSSVELVAHRYVQLDMRDGVYHAEEYRVLLPRADRRFASFV